MPTPATMTDLDIPPRIAALPRNQAGYPVPWFVAWFDGVPDFRVVAPGRIDDALRFRKCWICGQHAGANAAFVIGPMCAVNRVSAEPPSHRDCAVFAARACPFLARPGMARRENNLPEETSAAPGVAILRNPGVALMWVTRNWSTFHAPDGGLLFDVGAPVETRWYAHGRDATRAEVLASIDSGLPILREQAEAGGPLAVALLERQHEAALAFVPAQ